MKLHFITSHHITLHQITLQYSTAQYNAVQYIALQYITLYYIALHTYIHAILHRMTLHAMHSYFHTYSQPSCMHVHACMPPAFAKKTAADRPLS